MNELADSKGCLATDTRSLREIAPLLENYFGITLGYFTNEIESSTRKHAAKAIQEDHEIRLPTNRFDYDAYMELFGETPLLTDRLREALLFVAYIITDRKFNEEDLYERGYWEDWNIYKGEWAKLMLFMEHMEQRASIPAKQDELSPTSITLRADNGIVEKSTIPNTDNWLFRLIRKELADYFPDIRTAEEARQELDRRKPSAGAKRMNAIYTIIEYGIYRMLHEENAIPEKPDIPNELCALIHDFTRLTGCYPTNKGWDGNYSPDLIRVGLQYTGKVVRKIGEKRIPKFPPVSFGTVHIVTDNIVRNELF
ncbi:hypothetical protein [uncultured Alistipes sp.]|uniref:hypothetical protein n=1 Tax=Alistipes sp. TaxID=1872444 RepID=UPI0025967DED|nr:hypothetical protein [uncultured Alistipes sp.]